MRNFGFPERWQLVICRIEHIDPNSATADLVEYNKKGIIHAAEVAKRWVKDIREFIKEGQYVVCRVMDVDQSRNTIIISIKRVFKEEANRKLREFKSERKAEKFLEFVAKSMNKTLDDAYKEVGYVIKEDFGSLSKLFELAVKNPELLRQRITKVWAEAIIETAKKSHAEKTYEVRAELKLVSYKPDGVDVIKEILSGIKGFEIKYISAPTYLLIGKGKNFKELRIKVEEEAERLVKEVNKNQGECDFKLIEN